MSIPEATTADTLQASPDAEKAVVASCLIDGAVTGDARKIVRPEDFHNLHLRAIYQACSDLYTQHQPVDVLLVKQWLIDNKAIAADEIIPLLISIAETVATAAHVEYYANIVAEKSKRRWLLEVVETAAKATRDGKATSTTVNDLWASIEDFRREDAITNSAKFRVYSAAELDCGNFEITYDIDNLLVHGQPCILAGPEKSGKTSIALDLGLSAATGGDSMIGGVLGHFHVSEPRRFLMCTGESGLGTIQETARRIG
jgi:replicative DNA helicase